MAIISLFQLLNAVTCNDGHNFNYDTKKNNMSKNEKPTVSIRNLRMETVGFRLGKDEFYYPGKKNKVLRKVIQQ